MTVFARMLLDCYMASWHKWVDRDERTRKLRGQVAVLRVLTDRLDAELASATDASDQEREE